MNKDKWIDILVKGAMVLLSVTFIIYIVSGIREIRDYDSGWEHMTEEYLQDILRHEDYGAIAQTRLWSMDKRKESSESQQLCEAVAGYYEAAVLAQSFESVGNETEAEMQRERMEKYRRNMGEHSAYADRIDEGLKK